MSQISRRRLGAGLLTLSLTAGLSVLGSTGARAVDILQYKCPTVDPTWGNSLWAEGCTGPVGQGESMITVASPRGEYWCLYTTAKDEGGVLVITAEECTPM